MSLRKLDEPIRVNSMDSLNTATFANNAGAMFVNVTTISVLLCCDNECYKSYYAASKRLGDNLITKYFEDNRKVLRR